MVKAPAKEMSIRRVENRVPPVLGSYDLELLPSPRKDSATLPLSVGLNAKLHVKRL